VTDINFIYLRDTRLVETANLLKGACWSAGLPE